ncbi:Bestrophin, RFP-TM, chloride channel [Aquisphaera giovannonii]|uniref:Bestrophin, RFP-TM, chloride channel n=1 Tax=Aquisphaera giovannonii TaxID=406548 RepID=A0A5B9VUQ4_9BACT|nr:bestrophin family ion channel [Aquisphaera giovannonii]QEH31988.1 Bestrophin, RFP-TM, chloride channel [Aquisphaera giovannonii]
MIEYDPNRHWLRDIRHLGTSWILRRLVRATAITGVYSVAVSVALIRLDLEGRRAISGTFSLLGVILGIILVFRTNSAYDRWWEGRKLWGSLANHSRNLAIQLDALLPGDDVELREWFSRLLADFALALSGHLRGRVDPSILAGPWMAEARVPPGSPPPHVPAHLARVLVRRVWALRDAGTIDGFGLLATQPHTQALLEVAGACDRIRRTPIPFSYSVFIRLFLLAYAAILPVGLVPEYGYLAVPLVMLLVFALLGLELMAAEIEDPFGLDCNDLPTHAIADAIRADTRQLLGLACNPAAAAPPPYSKVF